MRRMYAEGNFPLSADSRDIFAQLMAELDKKAASVGHRVKDDVVVMEFDSPLVRNIRIEATVVAA